MIYNIETPAPSPELLNKFVAIYYVLIVFRLPCWNHPNIQDLIFEGKFEPKIAANFLMNLMSRYWFISSYVPIVDILFDVVTSYNLQL